MKIVINFPKDAKTKDIVKVLATLGPLEEDGYEFETVIGKPVRDDPQGLSYPPGVRGGQVEGPMSVPIPVAPSKDEDFDWMSLIDQDVPGASDQDDPSLRRRAQRVSDDEGTDRRGR
jgi:hypothetical protein